MEIIDLIEALGTWTWWVIAGVLLVLELLAPGIFFLWLAFSAAFVGAISLLIDWSWQAQIATFSVASVASLYASRVFFQKKPIETDRPFLNRRADRLVGQEFVLTEALKNGQGSVRVADSSWHVRGPDLEKGTMVKVVEISGGTLIVEPAKTAES